MVLFNYAIREITAKIVYYGPGLGGKTTNLQTIHRQLDPTSRGKLISLATDADRTLFFDFLPLDLGRIGGYRVRFQLYTVPGQVHYNATRKLVLKGVDAIVFVADAQVEMLDRNRESHDNLRENLLENGYDLSVLPIIYQFNKQDLPNVATREEVAGIMGLDQDSAIIFEGVATEGRGVFEGLKAIIKMSINKLRNQFEDGQFGISSQPDETEQAEKVIDETLSGEAVRPSPEAEEEFAVLKEPETEAVTPGTPLAEEVEEDEAVETPIFLEDDVTEEEVEMAAFPQGEGDGAEGMAALPISPVWPGGDEQESAGEGMNEVDLEAVLTEEQAAVEPQVEVVNLSGEEGSFDSLDEVSLAALAEESPVDPEEAEETVEVGSEPPSGDEIPVGEETPLQPEDEDAVPQPAEEEAAPAGEESLQFREEPAEIGFESPEEAAPLQPEDEDAVPQPAEEEAAPAGEESLQFREEPAEIGFESPEEAAPLQPEDEDAVPQPAEEEAAPAGEESLQFPEEPAEIGFESPEEAALPPDDGLGTVPPAGERVFLPPEEEDAADTVELARETSPEEGAASMETPEELETVEGESTGEAIPLSTLVRELTEIKAMVQAMENRIDELKVSTRENINLVESMTNTFLKGVTNPQDPRREDQAVPDETGDAVSPPRRGLLSRLFGGGGKPGG